MEHETRADKPPRLLRIPEVINRTGLSRTTIYRRMATGDFPQQRRLSHKVAVWSEEAVDAWVRQVIGGTA